MSLRLYISHASEDQAIVNKLRDELKTNGFQVFLCEDLPAGADWQKEMDLELKQTDAFVYCFSSASVARSGQYNDELKAARSRYRTEGEHAILIVPLRLDECSIPTEVKELMVLDLLKPDGLNQLLVHLKSRSQATSRHVFLLHGIKTRGKWQKDISPLLGFEGLIPIPLDFGSFGAWQLIWPPARNKKRQWLLDEYVRQCARLGCQSASIVAHSFGCYLVASVLKKYSEVRFDRIIFCGSIVHPAYPWADFAERGQLRSVLNQYGEKDFWAWVVHWAVEDAGPSGYSGFDVSCAELTQQKHPEFEHSNYFSDLNYKNNWIPFLLGKSLAAQASGPAAWQAPVNPRFRSVVAILLLLIAFAALKFWNLGSGSEDRHLVSRTPTKALVTPAPHPFGGFVQDDHGNPLPGVKITAPTLNIQQQETDANGKFSFQADLPAGTNFRLIVQKPGFETHTADPPAGDKTFNITLHKLPGRKNI